MKGYSVTLREEEINILWDTMMQSTVQGGQWVWVKGFNYLRIPWNNTKLHPNIVKLSGYLFM